MAFLITCEYIRVQRKIAAKEEKEEKEFEELEARKAEEKQRLEALKQQTEAMKAELLRISGDQSS